MYYKTENVNAMIKLQKKIKTKKTFQIFSVRKS